MMRVPVLVLVATMLAAALPSTPGSARSAPVPGEITFERELALGGPHDETRAVAVADFDGDGLPDIASLGISATSSILLLLGDNADEFARSLPVASDAPSNRIVAGDFDEDGRNDLMHGVLLLRGRGDGSFADPEPVTSESIDWPSEELASDLDGDGHLDLAITYEPVVRAGSRLVVLWGHGDGTFEVPSQVTYLSRGFRIHLAADPVRARSRCSTSRGVVSPRRTSARSPPASIAFASQRPALCARASTSSASSRPSARSRRARS